MHKISVPVMNYNVKRSDRKRLLQELRRFNAKTGDGSVSWIMTKQMV
jgi:hypothetical protein